MSERDYSYSWDDQDFEQLQDAVLDSVYFDPEDFDGQSCICEPDDAGCEICAESGCTCHRSEQQCEGCGHLAECKEERDCGLCGFSDSESWLETALREHDGTLVASLATERLIVEMKSLKSQIRELENRYEAGKRSLLEALGEKPVELVSSADPKKRLARLVFKVEERFSSSAKSWLRSQHPEVYSRVYVKRSMKYLYLEGN